MAPSHFPKIAAGEPPAWLVEHTARNAHVIGPPAASLAGWQRSGLPLPDLTAIRRWRLERIREQLLAADCDAILLYDPINLRYATDTTNMSVWTMHNAVRYALVPLEGPVILWEFSDAEFLGAHSTAVDEIRPATSFEPFYVGDRAAEWIDRWADEIVDVMHELVGGSSPRLAADDVPMEGGMALVSRGMAVIPGHLLMELARTVKCDEEVAAMRCAIQTCEAAIETMRAGFEPGVTELDLWTQLQAENFRRGGEWGETRLLSSGPRTNPWYHEVSAKAVEAGEIMAFDTDLIGPFGMCVDMSRSWLCGGGSPSGRQADVFARARDGIEHNVELFVAGASYREITEALRYPSLEEFNGYTVMAHGTGLCDEYPSLFVREKWQTTGFDGIVEVGNVFSVEAFVGRRASHGGGEGVKLEQQILVTEVGPELLTTSSLDLT